MECDTCGHRQKSERLDVYIHRPINWGHVVFNTVLMAGIGALGAAGMYAYLKWQESQSVRSTFKPICDYYTCQSVRPIIKCMTEVEAEGKAEDKAETKTETEEEKDVTEVVIDEES